MTTYTGTEGINIKYGNGFNSNVWVSNKGFKTNAGFPTTGFNQAVFNVIGSGSDQQNWL